MQYIKLREELKDFTVFSPTDIRKVDPGFYRSRLNDWQNKNYITKLRNGYYMAAGTPLNEERLFLIANKLYAPSYVSFEIALSYYGLIPEGVYSVTSATTNKTAKFKTPVGEFSYRSIKPQLLFGYSLQGKGTQVYKLAEVEKAVLDYLYVNPKSTQPAHLHEWRFAGKDFLAKADISKFEAYARTFGSPSLERRAQQFLKFIKSQD